MGLNIVKANEALIITQLVACVYSPPGIGKTSLGFTAEAPLLLDFDRGAHRSANRGDVVPIGSWEEVSSLKREDFANYKTVVVDTAGRALDMLTVEIIADDPKKGSGGALNLQGYGVLKARFLNWTKLLRSFGLDVVLLAHSDEQRKGDEVIIRIDVQGGSRNEIYKSADMMGQLYIRGRERVLDFSPSDTAYGKNPAGLPELVVPNFAVEPRFLGKIIAQTKDTINSRSEEARAAAEELERWREQIDKAKTLEDFNKLVAPASEASESVRNNVKRMLVAAGKKATFLFDAKQKVFVAAATQP